jgi:hypothetical protein
MNDSYTSAMFARVDPPVLLDEEVATEKWPRPEPFVWSPKPRGLREFLRLCLRRFRVWLIGEKAV